MRKLVSVRRIAALEPIPGADKIEVVKIDGWQVISNKIDWPKKVGDYVAFFEVDSFLPVWPEYEFLRKSSFKSHPDLGDGFRLKTMKMKGVLSQGLIMPLKEVLAPTEYGQSWEQYQEEGVDLTEMLGVKLYEKAIPQNMAGKASGTFPHFIQKTDQERVQNIIKYLHQFDKRRKYQATLKLDGSSMTVYKRGIGSDAWQVQTNPDGITFEYTGKAAKMWLHHAGIKAPPGVVGTEIGVCSRNMELKMDEPTAFSRTYEAEGLEQKIRNISEALGDYNIALQGELMGPGVQGNREKFEEHRFYLYDIWSITEQRYLDPHVTWQMAVNFDLRHVPVINYVSLGDMWDDADPVGGFLKYADRASINHEVAEGVVFKAIGDGPRHSFKVINNTFLLKEKD